MPILTDRQREIVVGSLLGDAYLSRPAKDTYNSCLRILRSSNDRDYLCWQFDELQSLCSVRASISDGSTIDGRTGSEYFFSRFNTRSLPVFTTLRKLWYPQGVKVVPDDLELTPLSIAVWFCDDGCLYRQRGCLSFSFATDGFDEESTSIAAEQLKTYVHCYINPHENGFIIRGHGTAADDLVSVIRDCFPAGIDRKLIPHL